MSTTKTKIKINASSLINSKCLLDWHRTIIEGYKEPVQSCKLIYGVAVHKYIDTMFKTKGHLGFARESALKEFRKPKIDDNKSPHMSSEVHLLPTCFNLWDDYVMKDLEFQILQIYSACWWCDGLGIDEAKETCAYCKGEKFMMQPATEVTFEIKYFEDADFEVWLCGTIDKLGQIVRGCFAIGDWKTTSRRDTRQYLEEYEMSAQLRFYVFALKLMAKMYPESMLGKIGATRIGAFVDGVFLKPKVMENEYARSNVFQFSDSDLNEFQVNLDRVIARFLQSIRDGTWKLKEGIMNGACQKKFSRCAYWHICKAQSPEIESLLLSRNFIQKEYNPLKHND